MKKNTNRESQLRGSGEWSFHVAECSQNIQLVRQKNKESNNDVKYFVSQIPYVPWTYSTVPVSVLLLHCALCFTKCVGVFEVMEKIQLRGDTGENHLTYVGSSLSDCVNTKGEDGVVVMLIFFSFVFFVVIFQDFVKVSKPTGETCGWKWTLWGSHGLIKAQLKKLKPHWASTQPGKTAVRLLFLALSIGRWNSHKLSKSNILRSTVQII